MTTDIKIMGKTYAVRSEFDEAFARETAELVNNRMRELATKMGALSTERIAVLAAMNFAGELLRLRQESNSKKTALKQKAQRVLELLDAKE